MTVIPEFDRMRCMIDDETFRERDPNYDRWVFQRGWNAALTLVLEKMDLIERGNDPPRSHIKRED